MIVNQSSPGLEGHHLVLSAGGPSSIRNRWKSPSRSKHCRYLSSNVCRCQSRLFTSTCCDLTGLGTIGLAAGGKRELESEMGKFHLAEHPP